MTRRSPLASLLAAASVCTGLIGLAGCLQLKGHGDEPAPPTREPERVVPIFGPTVSLKDAPPPLSGGTLLMTANGSTAIAADPDRDRVVIVDLDRRSVRATLALSPRDEPGRSVEDRRGKVHLVLRGGGAIADIDVAGTVIGRRAVCPAPRGIAYDAPRDSLIVACAGGELVTLPAAGGDPTRSVFVERDLRDVVIDAADGTLVVTTLRQGQLLTLDEGGAVSTRIPLPVADEGIFSPAIAWRAAPIAGGGIVVSHQRAADHPVQTTSGGYGDAGNGCGGGGGIVHATATVLRRGADGMVGQPGPILSGAVLPVDVAVSPSGREVAIVAAGNAHVPGGVQLITTTIHRLESGSNCESPSESPAFDGEAIAAAYDLNGNLYVQTREPAHLQFVSQSARFTIDLGGASRADTGWAIFHSNSGAGIACASCHAEGGDDARTWEFENVGLRRTQSLRGGITGRAPFHWTGDQPDFSHLVGDVFVGRMSGPHLADDQMAALARWVDAIPTLPPSENRDGASVAHGRQLFADPTVGCAGCHSGAKLTNNRLVFVGTGGSFKVASLVDVASHAPYLHNGCARTLIDRFGPMCGGGDRHGHTSQLGQQDLRDLVAYLETL